MKVIGWRSALDQVFQAADGKPFAWGKHDCCQFAADCIHAVTGRERRTLFPNYTDEAGATEILERYDGMRGLLSHALGEPVSWELAMTGDIALIDMGQGMQPAVCVDFTAYAPGARALERRPSWMAAAAWVL
jgi:hypothetical protein